MSLVLAMLRANEPLHKWEGFDSSRSPSSAGVKHDTRKMAQKILSQCSHPKTVELVAREFYNLPERLRIDFRTLASDHTSASGNVRKGLQRLNEKLGGKLLAEEHTKVFQQRVETRDGVKYRKIKVDEAVAGAKRKYGKL